VLITDIAMPLQDGHEMVQRLRESLGSRSRRWSSRLSAFARSEKDTERFDVAWVSTRTSRRPFEPDFLVADDSRTAGWRTAD
jgi:CheY-like chemotaxis protein